METVPVHAIKVTTINMSRDFPDQTDFPGHGPFWDAGQCKTAF
jgi:hypothetical protein